MKGNALRRFIAVFIVVAMMLTPVLALAEDAELGIEAPVAETGTTLGEETTTDAIPEGESAPVEAVDAYDFDDLDSEEIELEITKAANYPVKANVRDTISASLDMEDVEIISCKSSSSAVVVEDWGEDYFELIAKAAGSAKVTVKLSNKKTVTVTVKVTNPLEPTKISFIDPPYTIAEKEILDLGEMVEYDGYTTLTFSSNKTSVVAVNKTTGEAVGRKPGSATITVKTSGGKSAKCTVKVLANEIKDLWKKPSKSQILEYCEGGWTFVPVKIRYNGKTDQYDCQFYLLNGTTSKIKAIENLNISLLCDGDVIAEATIGTKKVAASKYGYKKFDVSMDALEEVFLPLCDDLLIGYDEDIVAIANDKYQTELEFIPVDDVHEEGTEPDPGPQPTPEVEKITLDDTAEVTVGGSKVLKATIAPSGAETKLTWSSSDPAKVSVNNDGVVSGVAVGTAVITATSSNGKVSNDCTVTVNEKVIDYSIDILEESSITLYQGESRKLNVSVSPETEAYSWGTSKPDCVSVDKDGVIKAEKVCDEATIVASLDNGKASDKITVKVVKDPTKLYIEPEAVTVKCGYYQQLTSEDGVTWMSADTSIAKVVDSNGKVRVENKAKDGDTVEIYAIKGGQIATCVITVEGRPITGVSSLSPEPTGEGDYEGYYEVEVGGNRTLTAVYNPTAYGVDYDSVTIESSDPKVVTVVAEKDKIKVTGVKSDGVANIVMKTSAGTSIPIAQFHVPVKEIPSTPVYANEIKLNKTSMNLVVGETAPLSVSQWIAKDATQTVTETTPVTAISNNTSVASWLNGTVTANAVGEAVITVSAPASATTVLTATCKVTVTAAATPGTIPVEDLDFATADKTKTMKVGDTATLNSPVFYPVNATEQGLIWSSSDENYATVSQNGEVTAIAATPSGTPVTITAKAKDNIAFYDTCAITINEIPAATKTVKTISIASSTGSNTIDMGATTDDLTLTATVTYSDGSTDNDVTWSCTDDPNEEYIELDTTTGKVTGVGVTTTPIKVKATKDTKTAVYPINVVWTKHIGSVAIDRVLTTSLTVGQTRQLSVSVYPNHGDLSGLDTSVKWKSMNPSCAKVSDDGLVTALAAGSAQIVATSNENSSAMDYVVFTVTEPTPTPTDKPITGITVANADKKTQVEIGKTLTLTATLEPSDTTATDKTVEWSNDDPTPTEPSIASVDSSNLTATVTGVGVGKIKVTATNPTSGKSGYATISVVPTQVVYAEADIAADGSYDLFWLPAGNDGANFYKIVVVEGTTEMTPVFVAGTATYYNIPASTFTVGKDYKVYVYATTSDDPNDVDVYVESPASDAEATTFTYK